MYKTIDVMCHVCESVHIQSVDVPSGESLPDIVQCEKCGAEGALRLISFNIAKKQIEERVHGGERLPDGRILRRDGGWKSAREYSRLNRQLKKATKNHEWGLAQEVHKEMQGKKKDWKKDGGV